ncbi:MAG: helix-turn-helix domain-containing protein, partial [Candidatus Magasanikbacteria bacterium]
RLRSRFEGGMVADISYPDYEMRLAILKNKAQMNNWNVEEKILEIIASKIQRNIRELEGVLNKVVFYQDFKEQKIDEDKLEEIINEASQISAQNVGADDIMETVTDFFDITEDKLISKSRKKEVVKPRQICMYLMREILDLSYPNIGEKIGDRDHTTVIHACEKIEEKFRKDSNLNQDIMLIKERLLE